jgi:hypothetical protein
MTEPTDNSPLYRSAVGYQQVVAHYDVTLQEMELLCESVVCGDAPFLPEVVVPEGSGRPTSTLMGDPYRLQAARASGRRL